MPSTSSFKKWSVALGAFLSHPVTRLVGWILGGVFGLAFTVSVYAGQKWLTNYIDTTLKENPRISLTIQASEKMDAAVQEVLGQVKKSLDESAKTRELAVSAITATQTNEKAIAQIKETARIRLAEIEKDALLKAAEQDKRLALLEQDMNRKRDDDRRWQSEIIELLKKTGK